MQRRKFSREFKVEAAIVLGVEGDIFWSGLKGHTDCFVVSKSSS